MDAIRLKTQKLLEKLQPKYGMAPKCLKSPDPPTSPVKLFFKVYNYAIFTCVYSHRASVVHWRVGVETVMYFDRFLRMASLV